MKYKQIKKKNGLESSTPTFLFAYRKKCLKKAENFGAIFLAWAYFAKKNPIFYLDT